MDGALEVAGFAAYQDTRVMKLALSEVTVANARRRDVRAINVEQFTDALGRLHGLDAAKAQAERDRFARSAVDSVYLAQYEGDAPIACGSIAVDGSLAGIFGMVTAADHRGRGIATTLVAELLAHARGAGATLAYLQVEAENTPARRAYAKFGFEDSYAYWYRTPHESDEL
ncbi:MAG: GNAT family N-acetyltransferase [Burkholderiaceae bacterium]|nr:GNAT family N-acetyltransferase [Burkholderiaceae bacterium]